ncbi:hypothetical protein D3C85_1712590 [compost metagenome]
MARPSVALVVTMLDATPTISRPTLRLATSQAIRLMKVPMMAMPRPIIITGRKPMRSGRRPRNSSVHSAPPM